MSQIIRVVAAPTDTGMGGVHARALLSQLYRDVTGQPMPQLLRQHRGKPYFSQGPWHCSISHTKTLALCALANCPVGLDAESMGRQVRPALVRKVLSPAELSVWQTAEDPSACFLTFWTLKEAAVKYTGQGLSGYPFRLSFQVSGDRATMEGSELCFRLWSSAGHIIALCAPETPDCSVELRPTPSASDDPPRT